MRQDGVASDIQRVGNLGSSLNRVNVQTKNPLAVLHSLNQMTLQGADRWMGGIGRHLAVERAGRFYRTSARDLLHIEKLGLQAKILDLAKTSSQLIDHLRSKGVKIIEVFQQKFALGAKASALMVIHCCDELIAFFKSGGFGVSGLLENTRAMPRHRTRCAD
jgi:hypothetical protein